jgi:RHS repeat-associated protein
MLSLSVNTNNQITNSGFSYDAAGDLTGDGVYTYSWNAERRLTSAANVTYTYDGILRRVEKSSGTLYWYSPAGAPLAETDSSGNTLNEYVFFGGARVARRDSSGNVYYYFQDYLGTTETLSNSSGALCYDADFLPFGYEKPYVASCGQNYKFTGLERDGETGLDHTLNRKYDSSLGRWLTPDRKGGNALNPQSLNRYAYVMNNPTNFTDPLGLFMSTQNNGSGGGGRRDGLGPRWHHRRGSADRRSGTCWHCTLAGPERRRRWPRYCSRFVRAQGHDVSQDVLDVLERMPEGLGSVGAQGK